MTQKLQPGHLTIVSIGPGDPDLITFKAAKAIAAADVVAFPVGGDSGKSMARTIAAQHISEGAAEYGYLMPMRTERLPGINAYDEAAKEIRNFLNCGRSVALLCEGDAFFYGSAMYLYTRLSEKFETDIIPGVTSLTACAATLARPLAARNERLKILPAPLDEATLRKELMDGEASAIIKVGRHFEKIRTILTDLGLAPHARIIEAATTEDERILALSDVPEGERPYFSTILVYRGEEAWGKKDV